MAKKKTPKKKVTKKTSKKRTKKAVNTKVAKKTDDKVIFAFLATFLSIIGFLVAVLAKKDDEYVMFYAKQSLVIFVMAIVSAIVIAIVRWIPVIGWILSFFLQVVVIVMWILSWLYALTGEMKYVPMVENWANKIKF